MSIKSSSITISMRWLFLDFGLSVPVTPISPTKRNFGEEWEKNNPS